MKQTARTQGAGGSILLHRNHGGLPNNDPQNQGTNGPACRVEEVRLQKPLTSKFGNGLPCSNKSLCAAGNRAMAGRDVAQKLHLMGPRHERNRPPRTAKEEPEAPKHTEGDNCTVQQASSGGRPRATDTSLWRRNLLDCIHIGPRTPRLPKVLELWCRCRWQGPHGDSTNQMLPRMSGGRQAAQTAPRTKPVLGVV